MAGRLLILTGASGVGKTTISRALAEAFPEVTLLEADTMVPPPSTFLAEIGPSDGPGGAFQRSRALFWIGRLATELAHGERVLLDFQCRIAFLREALERSRIAHGQIVLVACERSLREERLRARGSQALADERMQSWADYLLKEAALYRVPVLNTRTATVADSVQELARFLSL